MLTLLLSTQHPIDWSDMRAIIFCQIFISIWMMLILSECRHRGIGIHNCEGRQHDAVGVVCTSKFCRVS